jgi:hypothetical protein
MLREGLRLYAYNQDLSHELGDIVIRHRRRAEHRVCRVGSEYVAPVEETLRRSDRSVLHASRGMDVHGEAELPHYLLMRCVSEMKGGKGRTSLGTALTGCYSTLLGSSEGRALKTALGHGTGKTYLDLLLSMVGEAEDPHSPQGAGSGRGHRSRLALGREGPDLLLQDTHRPSPQGDPGGADRPGVGAAQGGDRRRRQGAPVAAWPHHQPVTASWLRWRSIGCCGRYAGLFVPTTRRSTLSPRTRCGSTTPTSSLWRAWRCATAWI